MLTCKKTYRDIPFAHRQHRHQGHCALIHGHNWSLTLTFACDVPDENGFVVDFGGLKYLSKWIEENLDHACLFSADDPLKEDLLKAFPELFKAYELPNCSSEGIAMHVHEVFDTIVRRETRGRVWIKTVEVEEDSRNSARYDTP